MREYRHPYDRKELMQETSDKMNAHRGNDFRAEGQRFTPPPPPYTN